jgi:hypothetical protein
MASQASKRLNWPYIIISGHCSSLLKPTSFFEEAKNLIEPLALFGKLRYFGD